MVSPCFRAPFRMISFIKGLKETQINRGSDSSVWISHKLIYQIFWLKTKKEANFPRVKESVKSRLCCYLADIKIRFRYAMGSLIEIITIPLFPWSRVKLMVHFKGGCLHALAKRIILIETINTAPKLLFFIGQLLIWNAALFIYLSGISKGQFFQNWPCWKIHELFGHRRNISINILWI